jgi:NADH-quinone oxidoreductase subunit M
MTPAVLAGLLVWICVTTVAWAPSLAHPRGEGEGRRAARYAIGTTVLAAGALVLDLTAHPAAASALLGVAAVLHAAEARGTRAVSVVTLAVVAVLQLAVAVAVRAGHAEAAWAASLLAITLASGAVPLHVGASALAARAPAIQTHVLASVLSMTWVHLRDLDHVPLAHDAAPAVVRFGAVVTLAPALTALVAADVRALYRGTVRMHAGMLLMALGAAGHGHYGAALFAALTLALATAGLGIAVAALEARSGRVGLNGLGGRLRAFPALAAAFAVFGAAGVGLPGTAGFIADDLLLHAVWEESAVGAAVLILASATLAIALWRGWSRVFFGAPVRTVAPDLDARERGVLVALLALLLMLGLAPQAIVSPASAVLGAPPADAER